MPLARGWTAGVNPNSHRNCITSPEGRCLHKINEALQSLGAPTSRLAPLQYVTASQLQEAAALADAHGLVLLSADDGPTRCKCRVTRAKDSAGAREGDRQGRGGAGSKRRHSSRGGSGRCTGGSPQATQDTGGQESAAAPPLEA